MKRKRKKAEEQEGKQRGNRSTAGMTSRGVVAVVGVGRRLGRSIAKRFAHEGYTIAILSRNLDRLYRFADEIAGEENAQVFAIRIDCSDSRQVEEAFEGIHSLGFVEVLVYNVSAPTNPRKVPKLFSETSLESFQHALQVSVVGAFQCAQQVLPGMVERRKGTILFTGCAQSVTGSAGLSALACGKFAVRGLAQCLAREYQPQGIHIAHVIVDGITASATVASSSNRARETQEDEEEDVDGSMNPDAIAQMYWHLHNQDRSAWTHELDLRSSFSASF